MSGNATSDSFYEASPSQARLWTSAAAASTLNAYVPWTALRLRGTIDADALDQAFCHVVRTHDILRTALAPQRGMLRAHVTPSPTTILERSAAADGAHLESELVRIVTDAASRTDIAAGRPLAATLTRGADNDQVLVIAVHHAAFDGGSWPLLCSGLSDAYDALSAGRALPAQPVQQFASVAERQHQTRSRPGYADALDRTVVRLADLRDAADTSRAGGNSRWTADGVGAKLREAASTFSTTPSTVALAALLAHTASETRRSSLVAAIPFDDRLSMGVPDAIGPVLNTLAFRVPVPETMSFRDLVAVTNDALLDAIDDSRVIFEDVIASMRSQGLPVAGEPLPLMFQMRMHAPPTLTLPGVIATPVELPRIAKTALEVDLRMLGSDLSIEIVGHGGMLRINPETASSYARSIERLLADPDVSAVACASDGPASSGAAPSEAMASGAGDSDAPTAPDAAAAGPVPTLDGVLNGLVRRRALTRPDDEAIRDAHGSLTYLELADRVDDVAGRLAAAGLRPGSAVVVQTGRSINHVIAAAGVIDAGGWYVPISPGEPVARADEMMMRCGARHRIDEELRIRPTGVASRSFPAAWSTPGPDAPAYAMFTSGSTGTPKGVVVPHRAVVRLADQPDPLAIAHGEAVAFSSNPSFDAATFEIWATLASGGTVIVVDHQTMLDPESLERTIRDRGISTMFLTTALFNAVARSRPSTFASLRRVLFGGEAASPQAVSVAVEAAPTTRFVNCYGPTEGTVFSCVFELTANGGFDDAVPIGTALRSTTLLLKTAERTEIEVSTAPEGAEGELLIAGDGLALGYLDGDPDRRFQRNDGGFVRYRSGDLVRIEHGSLVFVRRVDTQFKRRGHRIEPLEIEAAMRTHPAVSDVAVVGNDRSGRPNDELVAFVVNPADVATPSISDIRRWLADRLPPPMLPDRLVLVSDLPRNENDKVDRTELRRLAGGHATGPTGDGRSSLAAARSAAAPGHTATAAAPNPLTEVVRAAYAHVLGGELPDPDDAFFDLGGSSIALVELTAHLREVTGVALSITTVLSAPTPATLASRIRFALADVQTGATSGPAVVFVPCAGESGELFADLVMHLHGLIPCRTLKAPDARGNVDATVTVEGNAEIHLAELGHLAPGSVIVGYSFGCAVAMEMATRLERLGAPPALVVLIDGRAPADPLTVRIRSYAVATIRSSPRHVANRVWASTRGRLLAQRSRRVAAERIDTLVDAARKDAKTGLFREAIDARAMAAIEEWRPNTYRGDALFIGRTGDRRSEDNQRRWLHYIRGTVTTRFFNARHYQLVGDPYAEAIAVEITAFLRLTPSGPRPDEARGDETALLTGAVTTS